MFGIGPFEFGVVLVLALLIMGPKKLPELARTLGRGMAEFRKASNELRRSIDMDLEEHKIQPPPGPAQAGLESHSADKKKKKKGSKKEDGEASDASPPTPPPNDFAPTGESVPVGAAGVAADGHGDGSEESTPVDTSPPKPRDPAPR